MSFLRSIVADASSRKRMCEPSHGPPAMAGLNGRALGGDAFGAEGQSQRPADQTNRLSMLLPAREGACDVGIGETPAFRQNNPFNRDTEPASSLTGIGDMSESTGGHANSTLQAVEGTGQLGVEESMPSATDGNTPAKGEVTGVSVHDDRHHSESLVTGPEALTIQPDATHTIDLTSRQSSSPIESSVFEPSGQVSGKASMPEDSTGADEVEKALADGGKASTAEPETLTIQADATHAIDLNSPQGSRRIESGVFEPSGQSSRQASMPDNYAGAHEVETASADGGKARQVSSSVDKQADLRNPSRQQDISRLKKPDETKGVPGDVQLISHPAMVMDSHMSSDMGLASVRQSAGKKATASARSPGSGPSKPGSPIQHIAGPAISSASPKARRSVPARPFLTDLTPKGGDSFHSRLPLRSPERKHEEPKVQIGQIDVIIEAARPATRPAPASSPVDLASRHYLRRL